MCNEKKMGFEGGELRQVQRGQKRQVCFFDRDPRLLPMMGVDGRPSEQREQV